MKIVVVGAGEVGYNVSRDLSSEGHDVTVVEQNDERASKTEGELDVSVVRGNGSRPSVLEKAGVYPGCNTDILVACSNRDEVNIMACWIAKRSGVSRVISRARGMEFTDSDTWAKEFGIDVMSTPERSVAKQIEELLQVHSAVHTSEIFGGKAGIYAFRVAPESPLKAIPLHQLREKYPGLKSIMVFIERNNEGFVPSGETILEEGDLIYVVSFREQVWQLEELFQCRKSRSLKRVIIVGGGKIGTRLAKILEDRFRNLEIKLIDRDREKCERLSGELERTIVLVGDGADDELLKYEGIEDADGFVTTTTSDEANILMGVIGKALGARKSIAVVRRDIYNRLDDYITVDALVNPNEALASIIMRYIRYPSGAASLSIIDKIGPETSKAKVIHYGDYDPAGLGDYLRIRSAREDATELFIPPDLNALVKKYGSETLLEKSAHLIPRLHETDDETVKKVLEVLLRNNRALEQEALLAIGREVII